MPKTELTRVQEMACQSESFRSIVSVKRIGDDRMTDGVQMNTNLVHHASFHRDFQ